MPSNKISRQPITQAAKRPRSVPTATYAIPDPAQPPTATNEGLMTLNVQALTATITAAVSHGVQAALAAHQSGDLTRAPAIVTTNNDTVRDVVDSDVADIVAGAGTVAERPQQSFGSVAIS